jgi:hypothetical protein
VTLTIDPVRSDLLLETELRRFAEPLDRPGPGGHRQYRVTPASLAQVRDGVLGLRVLEDWFVQRTGHPVPPAVRLLLSGGQLPPLELRREVVLSTGSPEVADGLFQWPGTRTFLLRRLGPTTLAVAEEELDALLDRLRELGLTVRREPAST